MKKFAAMANKPRAEKIKLLKKDKWNAVYLLAFLTCLGMILLSFKIEVFFDDSQSFSLGEIKTKLV